MTVLPSEKALDKLHFKAILKNTFRLVPPKIVEVTHSKQGKTEKLPWPIGD